MEREKLVAQRWDTCGHSEPSFNGQPKATACLETAARLAENAVAFGLPLNDMCDPLHQQRALGAGLPTPPWARPKVSLN